MRTPILAAGLALLLVASCAITNYPVIRDSRGGDGEAVLVSNYEPAYVIPSAQVAYVWPDGSDELFTLVVQDWKADQWLKTYDNFDPTAAILFVDRTYCDPTRGENCPAVVSWNPDLPELAIPVTPNSREYDDPFDYALYPECAGARSLSMLLSMSSRIGECGSGIWYDPQALAAEFANLETTTYHGRVYYLVPLDDMTTRIDLVGEDGVAETMPIFGRFESYVDRKLRMMVPVTPNARHQLRWLASWVANHGHRIEITVTYGVLVARVNVAITATDPLQARF